MMRKILVLLLAALVLASCSSMYIKPEIQPTLFKQTIPGNASLIFKGALKVLPMLGYAIEGSNAADGTITTAPMDFTINPDQCDCGSAFGIPLVKSEGIKAKVSFILAVSGNELAVKADIVPEMTNVMSTLAAAGITFTCISKGNLEKILADQFVEKMKTNALKLLFGK